MSDSQWTRIIELFPDALARPEEERSDFLNKACRAPDGTIDHALIREISGLLVASDAADSHGALAPPLAGLVEDIALEHSLAGYSIPERVGPWRPTHRIGSGGMGVVYAAERIDESFTQLAAVKLIRAGFVEDFHTRFIRERAILASLVHPGIARLLDGGVADDGAPYIALELVDGQPLTQFSETNNLSTRERIELFLQACDAVAFAHQNLVVHRDLKPSNILVSTDTPNPTIKLLDFGIAKLLSEEDPLLTLTGTGAMTPAYAAPEQVLRQPITTATDVYSLGVVLYELLTGSRPYKLDSLTAANAERVIATETPELPSAVTSNQRHAHELAGELDHIIMKALSKETDRRYQSAAAFAEDLRRYLGGWPVRAKPDELTYRLRKFAARNRTAVLSSAAMLSLVAILGTLFGISLTAERNSANASAAVAREEAERAAAISGFLERILRSPNTRWYVEGTAKGADTPVRAVLNEASQQVDAEFADKPALRSDLHHILGDTYFGLGLIDEAERHHRMVLNLRQSIYEEPHPKIAEAYYYLSILVSARGDTVERVRLLRKALEMLLRNNSGNNFPFIANELAKLELDFGDLDTAQALANESVAFAKKHFVEDSSGFDYRQRTLYVGSWYNARIEAMRGNDEAAIEWMAYRDSVKGYIKEIADGKEPLLEQMASCETGIVLLNTNRFEEAESFLGHCLSASEAQYPGHYLSLAPTVELARLYELWDKPEKALVYEERARRYTAFADSIGAAIKQ